MGTSSAGWQYVDSSLGLKQLDELIRSARRDEPVVIFLTPSRQHGQTMAKLVRSRSGKAHLVAVHSGLGDFITRSYGTSLTNDDILVIRTIDETRRKASASLVGDPLLGPRLEKLNNKLFDDVLAHQEARRSSREDRLSALRRTISLPTFSSVDSPPAGVPVSPSAPKPKPPRRSPRAESGSDSLVVAQARRAAPAREPNTTSQAPRRALVSSSTSYKTFLRVSGPTIAPVRHHLSSWLDSKSIEASLLGPESGTDVAGQTNRSWTFDAGQVGNAKALRFRLVERSPQATFTTEVAAYESAETDISWVFIHVSNDADLTTDTPRLAHMLIPALNAYDGRWRVDGYTKQSQASVALEKVCDPERQLPVLVFATDDNLPPEAMQGLQKRAATWTSKLTGQAHIELLSPSDSTEFNRTLSPDLQCRPWSIRIYRPGFDPTDPLASKQHRFISTRALAETSDSHLQRRLLGITRAAALTNAPLGELRRVDNLLGQLERQRRQQAELDAIHRRVEATSQSDEQTQEQPPNLTHTTPSAAASLLEELRVSVLELFGVEDLTRELLELVQDQLTAPDESFRADQLEQQLSELDAELAIERDLAEDIRGAADAQLADLEDRLQKLEKEAQYYKRQLAESDPQAAYSYFDDAEAPYQSGIDGVITAASKFTHVETTWDEDIVRDIEEWDTYGSVPKNAWDALVALESYGRDKADGFAGNFLDYVKAGHSQLGPSRVVPGESATTMARWGDERLFRVPKDVSEDCQVHMQAHIRISRVGGDKSPRLHFYDDTAGQTGKVYVGYLGPHLTNTQTANR